MQCRLSFNFKIIDSHSIDLPVSLSIETTQAKNIDMQLWQPREAEKSRSNVAAAFGKHLAVFRIFSN